MRILLIQARLTNDGAAADEVVCTRRRLSSLDAVLETRNALAEPASPQWLDGYDGIIIGGSGQFSVTHPDSQKWVVPLRKLLDACLEQDLPGFAICFGHQLLGLHLGRAVQTHEDHQEIGSLTFKLTAAGAADPVFSCLQREFTAHTGHSDHVEGVPADVELLATSARLQTQAFRVKGRRFYSTQFHPDLTALEARRRYLAIYTDHSPTVLERAAKFKLDGDENATKLIPYFFKYALNS